MEFSLNAKTHNIMANDRFCVYWETYCSGVYVYIKRGGKKYYLNSQELSALAKAIRFFESRGSSFDSTILRVCRQYS